MKRLFAACLLMICFSVNAAPRFATVEVVLHSSVAIAAWQFELQERHGSMTVVGVERGASPAFTRAPYFDRKAVAAGTAARIVVADFSTDAPGKLPSGDVHVATVHVMLEAGEPDFELSLIVAVDTAGEPVDATLSYRIP